jgi:hypothetical protein
MPPESALMSGIANWPLVKKGHVADLRVRRGAGFDLLIETFAHCFQFNPRPS